MIWGVGWETKFKLFPASINRSPLIFTNIFVMNELIIWFQLFFCMTYKHATHHLLWGVGTWLYILYCVSLWFDTGHIYPYHSGSHHWDQVYCKMFPVPVKQPRIIHRQPKLTRNTLYKYYKSKQNKTTYIYYAACILCMLIYQPIINLYHKLLSLIQLPGMSSTKSQKYIKSKFQCNK